MVTGRFDGGCISSDAGGVLLREVDKRIGVTARMSRCFIDYRNGASVEHDVHELVSQRVYGIALGYEDLNDHGELRGDAVLSLPVGKRDVTGEKRIRERERDRGYAPHRLSSIVGRRESKGAMSPIAGTAPVHRLTQCWRRRPSSRRARRPAAGRGSVHTRTSGGAIKANTEWLHIGGH